MTGSCLQHLQHQGQKDGFDFAVPMKTDSEITESRYIYKNIYI